MGDSSMNQQAIDELRSQRDAVRAALIAYASEFSPDADGFPDVGNIHANIRALKKERDEYQVEADALAAENKVLREKAFHMTSEQVVIIARTMSDIHAAACNVDVTDTWAIYGEDFLTDARIIVDNLNAALTKEATNGL
jgi:hypothetical protein